MAVDSNDLETTYSIEVVHNKKNVNDKFAFTPISKQVPTGLWGKPRVKPSGGTERVLPPNANDQRFVENTLAGFKLVPKNLEKPNATASICPQELQSNAIPYKDAYSWETMASFQSKGSEDRERRQSISNSIATNNIRNQLLVDLGFNPQDVNVSSAIADEFLTAPQIH